VFIDNLEERTLRLHGLWERQSTVFQNNLKLRCNVITGAVLKLSSDVTSYSTVGDFIISGRCDILADPAYVTISVHRFDVTARTLRVGNHTIGSPLLQRIIALLPMQRSVVLCLLLLFSVNVYCRRDLEQLRINWSERDGFSLISDLLDVTVNDGDVVVDSNIGTLHVEDGDVVIDSQVLKLDTRQEIIVRNSCCFCFTLS